jgi:trimeric autotransporter adhesin
LIDKGFSVVRRQQTVPSFPDDLKRSRNMNRNLLSAALVTAMLLGAGPLGAATFSYHGTLQDSGKPAEGNYDIELTLYSAPSGGSVIGGPLVMQNVPVHKGSFNTEADFGPLAKSFSQAYVGVSVRAKGQSDFTSLDTRAGISASPDTSSCPGAWTLQGNAGNPAGSFLGTVDTQPLTFQVNGTQVGQIVSSTTPDAPNVVFGSSTNTGGGTNSTFGGFGITIAGGGEPGSNCGPSANQICANQVAGDFATIGGGSANFILSGLGSDTISGGSANQASGGLTAIGGGYANGASRAYSTIAGGAENSVSGFESTVAGGVLNVATGVQSAILGGSQNTAAGQEASVPGGMFNQAGGDLSFAGGYAAFVRNAATAGNSGSCTSGINCGDSGTFMWADSSGAAEGAPFTSSGANQFLIKAFGGVAINGTPLSANNELTIFGNGVGGTNNVDIDLFPFLATQGFSLRVSGGSGQNPGFAIEQTDGISRFVSVLNLDSTGNLTISGGTATKPGGGSWTATSDRRIKQDITSIQNALDTVMKLRPVNFHYTPEYRAMEGGLADKGYQGFIAQEFAEVFPEAVVSTDKPVPGAAASDAPILALDPNPALITTVAAVQELAVRNQTNGDDITTLKQENAALRASLNAVLVRLNKLESQAAN